MLQCWLSSAKKNKKNTRTHTRTHIPAVESEGGETKQKKKLAQTKRDDKRCLAELVNWIAYRLLMRRNNSRSILITNNWCKMFVLYFWQFVICMYICIWCFPLSRPYLVKYKVNRAHCHDIKACHHCSRLLRLRFDHGFPVFRPGNSLITLTWLSNIWSLSWLLWAYDTEILFLSYGISYLSCFQLFPASHVLTDRM